MSGSGNTGASPKAIPIGPYMVVRDNWILNKKQAAVLGYIEWYPPWKCFIVEPRDCAIFNSGCLRDIAAYLDARTRERKAKKEDANATNS